MVLAPFEAVTKPWSVQPKRYVDEETTRVGGGKGLPGCLCKRAHEGGRVAGQLSHTALSTAENNDTWPTSKKPGIAILSALRACESWGIANPRRVENSIFRRRNSIETAIISVPLDVFKQYFVFFFLKKMGLLACQPIG